MICSVCAAVSIASNRAVVLIHSWTLSTLFELLRTQIVLELPDVCSRASPAFTLLEETVVGGGGGVTMALIQIRLSCCQMFALKRVKGGRRELVFCSAGVTERITQIISLLQRCSSLDSTPAHGLHLRRPQRFHMFLSSARQIVFLLCLFFAA